MYSRAWFDTFAAKVPQTTTDTEVAAVATLAPRAAFPRLLDLGCGNGRVAGPLAKIGYRVTGVDVNVPALLEARRRAPGPRYVALDQRHAGRMRWLFDVVVVFWNSFGFATREADLETLAGLTRILRPGGKLLLDLYHPDWLRDNEQSGVLDERGAEVHRWVTGGRCFHEIRYADGTVDDIQFNVYFPREMNDLAQRAGFETRTPMVWWNPGLEAGPTFARYQLVCVRPAYASTSWIG